MEKNSQVPNGGITREVDAGLQYELPVNFYKDNQLLVRQQAQWAIFMSANGSYTYLWTKRNGEWLPWRGELDTCSLKLRVYTDDVQPDSTKPPVIVRGAVSLQVKTSEGNDSIEQTFFIKNLEPPKSIYDYQNGEVRRETAKPGLHPVTHNNFKVTPIWNIINKDVTKDKFYPTDELGEVSPAKGETVVVNLPANSPRWDEIRFKKVVGITQAARFRGETDGSNFQCGFKNGKLIKLINGVEKSVDWGAAFVDHAEGKPITSDEWLKATGYDAPQEADPTTPAAPTNPSKEKAKDMSWFDITKTISGSEKSQFKVEFQGLQIEDSEARTDSTKSRNGMAADGISRYTQETVKFNLRNATRPWGFSVTQRTYQVPATP